MEILFVKPGETGIYHVHAILSANVMYLWIDENTLFMFDIYLKRDSIYGKF